MAKYTYLFILIFYSGMAVAQEENTPPIERKCFGPTWKNEFIPYTTVSGINGTFSQKGVTANIHNKSGIVPNNANVGIMGLYRITYKNKFMLSTEGRFTKLNAFGNNDKQSLNVSGSQTQVEVTGGVLVNPRFALLGGTRYNCINGTVKSSEVGGTETSDTKQWVDPFIGARLNFPIGFKFAAYLRGDFGGFGVGSNSTWQVSPTLEYKPNYHTSILVSYRYMNMNYGNGIGADNTLYNLTTQGVDVGFSVRF